MTDINLDSEHIKYTEVYKYYFESLMLDSADENVIYCFSIFCCNIVYYCHVNIDRSVIVL